MEHLAVYFVRVHVQSRAAAPGILAISNPLTVYISPSAGAAVVAVGVGDRLLSLQAVVGAISRTVVVGCTAAVLVGPASVGGDAFAFAAVQVAAKGNVA